MRKETYVQDCLMPKCKGHVYYNNETKKTYCHKCKREYEEV